AAVCRMLRPPPESQISRSHNVHAVQQTLNNGGSARIGNATSIANPVTDNRRGDRLDIFGNQVLAPINESPGFGTAQQRQRTAGRQSVAEFLRVSRITDQTLQVIQDAVAGLDLISRSLETSELIQTQYCAEFVQALAGIHTHQESTFGALIRITQLNAHEKAVQLRLRQGECTGLRFGILSGNNKKRLRQWSRHAFKGDLALFHGLQQGTLRLGRTAVDFVRQQNLSKNRARVEVEAVAVTIENGKAQ